MSSDPEGDRQKTRLIGLLDSAPSNAPLRFWWRDDDATEPSPALDRLLDLRRQHAIPLALAVIPAEATESLAERLASEQGISVFQHGWQHARHSPPGVKESEFGDHRPLPEMLDELRRGRAILERLFPTAFIPVLVPPWNRVGEGVRLARMEVGLPGISGFRKRPPLDRHAANTHVDVIDWMGTRGALSREAAFATLSAHVELRLAGEPSAVGLLSHHLAHDDPVWRLLAEILAVLAPRPGIAWPLPDQVFQLPGRHMPVTKPCD